jgi:membrane protein
MPLHTLIEWRQRWWRATPANRLEGAGLQVLRIADAMTTTLLEGRISLWAMSLVYTTLLSLTPLLALAFSLLKALGVQNSLQPLLLEVLKGLGPQQAEEVSNRVIEFVSNVQVGVLGSLGVSLLVYSALSLIQKVEAAFNEIWRVEKPRGISSRIGQYLAVLMVGPVVVFSALGLTASALSSGWVLWLTEIPVLGFAVHVLTTLLPYALIVGMFTFLYGFVPQAQVRPRAALIGGLCGGLLWQTASFIFAGFVAGAGNYNAIYSGFAIVLFVLIWLHLGWLILLCGCQLACFVQHPSRMNPYLALIPLAGRAREQLGLALLAAVTRRFARAEAPADTSGLASTLGVAEATLCNVGAELVANGWLVYHEGRWLPARDPAEARLEEVWHTLRGPMLASAEADLSRSGRWIDALESRALAQSGAETLKQWTVAADAAPGQPPPSADAAGEKSRISQ